MQCGQKLSFDAAHRVIGHVGKCKMLHGHRYTVEIVFESSELDEMGMVIDFGKIKEKLKLWLDNNWDHNTILSLKDKKLGDFIHNFTGQKIFYLDRNPTAENLANYLLHEVCAKLFNIGPKCFKIILHETPNCYAVVYNDKID